MESTTEPMSRSRTTRQRSTNPSPSSPTPTPTYGYFNTYHTHTQLPIGSPPPYTRAVEPQVRRFLDERTRTEKEVARNTQLPPPYSCTVEIEGIVGIKQELSSPFQASGHREWNDVYAILRGTQLSLYRIKNPGLLSKKQQPRAGRLLRTYSLQHAEVGIASDFKKTALVPKSPFAHLVPAVARPKLYETDPHLFEPVREHAIRLRLELEQFLLCPPTQEGMLDFVEAFCAAIDISSPLEDRSEPRYRSLPRRNRRQRVLDSARLGEHIESLSSLEAGRRIIAQQEQIIRQLYPHLAGSTREPGATANHGATADLEFDDFDPEDVRFPTRSARESLMRVESREYGMGEEERPQSVGASDPKLTYTMQPSTSRNLRYRRRCAPVLLASSPRVSDVVFGKGQRFRISVKAHMLVDYTAHPPRYDAHGFSKSKRLAKNATSRNSSPAATAEKIVPAIVTPERPASPIRGLSDDSITSISFGEDLAPARSKSNADESGPSGSPSPTGMSHSKMDAARQLETMGKRRASEDSRENGLSAVTLSVELIV